MTSWMQEYMPRKCVPSIYELKRFVQTALTAIVFSILLCSTSIVQLSNSSPTWIVQELLTSGSGTVYFDPRIQNYTQLIELPELRSLYVIANGNTLLRLHADDLRHLASFQLPSKPSVSLCLGNPEAPCEEHAAFNLLAKTQDGQNLWYCYIYQTSYMKNTIIPSVDSARCEIPTPVTLEPKSRLVQWENSVYSSLDLRKQGVYLMASDGFLYTSGWFHGALHIHRVLLPNFNGLPNWDQFLTTPASSDYIREPATFITVFETKEEVYFLFRESQSVACPLKVLNRPSEQPLFATTSQDKGEQEAEGRLTGTVTRLARVCKGDRGGYVYVNEGEFVTFAKATMMCTLRIPRNVTNKLRDAPYEEYAYTDAIAAKWDPDEERLYVIYGTPSGHPKGSALCIYTKQSIDEAFQSDLLSSNLAESSDVSKTIPNTFPNICSRFSSDTLTELDLDQGRRLSRDHLLRAKPIQPIGNQPILVRPVPGQPIQSNDLTGWKHLAVDRVGSSTVLYLASAFTVERYNIVIKPNDFSATPKACLIDRFQVGDGDSAGEVITEIHLLKRSPASEFYILTSKHVIRLSVTSIECSQYTDRKSCLAARNPYCVWDNALGLCEPTTFVAPASGRTDPHPSTRKESAMWTNLSNQESCELAFQHGPPRPDWWSLLSGPVALADKPQGPHEALPCPHTTSSPSVDGEQQYLTCWCRPCINCDQTRQPTMEILNCTIKPSWSPWSPWSACSVSCGNGFRTRTRRCDSPGPMLVPLPDGITVTQWRCPSNGTVRGSSPPDKEMQLEQCSLQPVCPHDDKSLAVPVKTDDANGTGAPFNWTAWSTCTAWCGLGIRTRHLTCRGTDVDQSSSGTTTCAVVGPEARQSELCLNLTCPATSVHTKWTEWFVPPRRRPSDARDMRAGVQLRQRLRFTCQGPGATTQGLRIGRVLFMERRCAPWNGACNLVSDTSEWSTIDMDSGSASSTPLSSSLGHWSSWGAWTPCSQACVPPVSVVAAVDRVVPVSPYSAPLYLHGGMQSRRRACLFASVSECPGGSSQANESRTCPPVPACHTDWSCWSDWSSCTARTSSSEMAAYHTSAPAPASCTWKADGVRKRVRQCVLGQSDWLANKPPACSGPVDETESCPRLEGEGTANCPARKEVRWSSWSAWTSCDESPMFDPAPVGSSRVMVRSGKNEPGVFRFRTRRCVTPSTPLDLQPSPVGTGACLGTWKQMRTCPLGALRMIAAAKSKQSQNNRERSFGLLHILLISALGFLIAAILTAIIILIIHCVRASPNGRVRPFVHRPQSNVYDQAEGVGSNTQLTTTAGYNDGTSQTVPRRNLVGPPQPLLTLPTPVKADMLMASRGATRNPLCEPPTVYDSVASQDVPTSFSLIENPFHQSHYRPYRSREHYQSRVFSDLQDRAYWSLPRQDRKNPGFGAQRRLSKPSTHASVDQFGSYPRGQRARTSYTMDDVTSAATTTTRDARRRKRRSHGHTPSTRHDTVKPRRLSYSVESSSHDHALPSRSNPPEYMNRQLKAPDDADGRGLGKHERRKKLDPMKPLFPEDGDSSGSGGSDNSSSNGTSSSSPRTKPSDPSIAAVPPAMPLLPVRYRGEDMRTSDQSQSPTRLSAACSMDWGPDRSSGRSEIYSICLERPQNPHLRDSSSHEHSPNDRTRNVHNP